LEQEGLTGKVIWPCDPEYEQARQEYNRAIDEYPLAIVYCYNNQDVANAILWSEENQVRLRIRSGGHNYAGYSTGTEKLVIDTTLMNQIEIDTLNDVVKVQAGARLRKLYEILYEYGYAFPGGTCPTVAISGLVLGGGIGLSARYMGLTIDSLIEAEMVDAKGTILIANHNCNPDLFWALRGAGGGNFGVVTSFTFTLKKKIDKITLIQLKWNNNQPARLSFLSVWQEWLEDLDRRMSAFGRVYKQGALMYAFFYGKPDEARRLLEPILSIPGITFESIEYVDFIDAVSTIGNTYPKSEKFTDTGRFMYEHLSDHELCEIIEIIDKAPTDYNSFVKVYSLGGAVSDVMKNNTAFYYRKANYIMAISSSWEENDEAPINKEWVAEGFLYIKKLTLGSYVNFPYSKLKDYQMAYYGLYVNVLHDIKTKYDPSNVFSFPQSIHPSQNPAPELCTADLKPPFSDNSKTDESVGEVESDPEETHLNGAGSLAPNPLDPTTIPKFVNQFFVPPVFMPRVVKHPISGKIKSHDYKVTVSQFTQQILPEGFPGTTVWGYGGKVRIPETDEIIPDFRSTPGPTFEAKRHIPINVKWINNLTEANPLAVDPTLHWADPNKMGMPMPPFPTFPPGFPLAQSPVPIVPHLHGGEIEPSSDGYPEAWFTAGEAEIGPAFVKSLYHYVNEQEPTTMWYHDHTLGITRLNVMMGLAGFYLLRDPHNHLDGKHSVLLHGKYEIPVVIQDRSFFDDGSLAFPSNGSVPDVHPYWRPAFLGNTIMVNGKVWPNLDVEPRQYRFRVLNGSNSRFYNLMFSNQMPFMQIGTDGGYLPKPVQLVSLLIAPSERVDILVDFSQLSPDTRLILNNTANAPFPNGNPPDPQTTGQIMQFTVLNKPAVAPPPLPTVLNVLYPLKRDGKKRTLTLYVVGGPTGPLELLLDGQKWHSPISELPLVGATEDWQIVNLTGGAHPIHIHLIQFRLLSRQDFLVNKYTNDWLALNGEPPLHHPTKLLPVEPYLLDGPINPPAHENGWKDTIQAYPGQVTTIRIRFAPQEVVVSIPGINQFPFNPAAEPGYVWHCHMLDHEDNDMMRPYKIRNPLEDC